VDTGRERVGTARLRKYVTTEHVQQTVPAQREQLRLEREPISDANRAAAPSSSPPPGVPRCRLTACSDSVRAGPASDQVRRGRVESDVPGEAGGGCSRRPA
jgi:hypothetical protein